MLHITLQVPLLNVTDLWLSRTLSTKTWESLGVSPFHCNDRCGLGLSRWAWGWKWRRFSKLGWFLPLAIVQSKITPYWITFMIGIQWTLQVEVRRIRICRENATTLLLHPMQLWIICPESHNWSASFFDRGLSIPVRILRNGNCQRATRLKLYTYNTP